MKGGYGILYSGSTRGPNQVLKRDPCPFGLPEMLTVAHVLCVEMKPVLIRIIRGLDKHFHPRLTY